MAAAWRRAWRSKVSSTTAHGGDTGTWEEDGRSLRAASGTGTTTTTTTTGSTTATHTTISSPVREGSLDLFYQRATAPVVEEISGEIGEEERVKKLEHIKALVQRFSSDDSAPERWLSELEVTWVHLIHVGESGRSFISGQLLYLARSWILALFEITKTISISILYFGGWCISKEDGPPASEFIRFFEAIMSKMLPFLDAIVEVRTSAGTTDWCGSVEPADEKLQALILVRDALSRAWVHIRSSLNSSHTDRLSAEPLTAKLDAAIWDTMEKTTNVGFMPSSWARRSPDIHPISRSFISYIKVLWANYRSVNGILHDAFLRGEFVMPENGNACHLTNLTIETVHSFVEKLTTMSQSFPDQSLKFLFLINNLHFIRQQLYTICPLGFLMPDLDGKIDNFICSYIRVSWAPVLECLHNSTTRCFTRRSPLPKFESKFQNTYTAQKLRKVPDPEMRKRMREAIVEEVIPNLTEFLKDNTISIPRISPEEMKRMLQELFEG